MASTYNDCDLLEAAGDTGYVGHVGQVVHLEQEGGGDAVCADLREQSAHLGFLSFNHK